MNQLLPLQRVGFIILLFAAAAIVSPAQSFTALLSFNGTNGAGPSGSLVQGIDGNLYGTTQLSGAYLSGTLFRISPGGALTTVYNFGNSTDGANPVAGLVQTRNREFYGTTYVGGVNGAGTIFKITPGGTFTTLYSFNSTDGAGPQAGLIHATNGNFYGTTSAGGANGYGTVFEITPGGMLTTLHSFDFSTDGAYPNVALVQAVNGSLYGTTSGGGANDNGTVFKITAGGALTTLHNFNYSIDGAGPSGALVQAANGILYGTTSGGGANGAGTVFKITPSGTLTTMYSFGLTDGANPVAGLIQANDGNLYGTTSGGGANGYGTVFTITPAGALTTLHSFDSTDGAHPVAGLVQATDGNFYGTASSSGASGDGTLFSLSVGLGPFVTTLPASAKVGATVIILGTNLTGATSVSFNGTAAVFTVGPPSLISTIVPTGASTGKVQVATPSGTLSSNVAFWVRP